LLLILFDVTIDRVWELEIAIEIAAVRIFGMRQYGELLFSLPLQDAFAARRIVVVPGDLRELAFA
jgi:hypothetical protein